MLTEFLSRLAIALPLVCVAAVLCLLAVKLGWIRLPGLALGRSGGARHGRAAAAMAEEELAVLSVKALTPAARVAVVRFDGRHHLIGVSGQALVLLDSTGPARGILAPAAGPQRTGANTSPAEADAWKS